MEPISSSTPISSQNQSKVTTFLNFPLRYIGSKSESFYSFFARSIRGEPVPSSRYHFEPEEELTAREAKSYIRYATLANIVPSGLTHWSVLIDYEMIAPCELALNVSTLLGNLHANHNRFFDKTTGLKLMLFANETEVVFAFGPAASYQQEIRDYYEGFKVGCYIWSCGIMANLAGLVPFIYTQAEALFLALRDHPLFANKSIILVGHSIGGSMASYIALKHQVKAIGFNTLALGAGLQKDIGWDKLAQAANYVTHLSVAGDIPSDCPVVHHVDRYISFAGITTPGNFGNHYRIPTQMNSQIRIHNEYLQALMDLASHSETCSVQEVTTLL